LLILTNSSFKDHLLKLEMVLARLSTIGMRVNISKSKFFAEQIEYLGYWITRQGIQPTFNKFEAILNIKVPKTRKELLQFIGIVNYYRDMWFRRSELLARFHWLASHQARSSLNGTHPINRSLKKSTLRKVIGTEVLLFYPDFNKPFHLYTDASDHQLGAVIMQDKEQNNYSLLFAKAQYSSKAAYNHWERVVISYWNLQGIQEYPVRLSSTQHNIYRP
jgi:hypothetical protein